MKKKSIYALLAIIVVILLWTFFVPKSAVTSDFSLDRVERNELDITGETLSLDDVVTLSKKGYDLTWSDFNQYKYFETGSGLCVRIYNINEQFGLMIGGSPDRTPMYIYLCLSGSEDTRIDIRDGGVEEFITKDY